MEGSEDKVQSFHVVNPGGRSLNDNGDGEQGRSGLAHQSRTGHGAEKGRVGAEDGPNDSLVIDEDKQNEGKCSIFSF